MRSERNDLRPVADLLLEGGDTPEQERTRHKAALPCGSPARKRVIWSWLTCPSSKRAKPVAVTGPKELIK